MSSNSEASNSAPSNSPVSDNAAVSSNPARARLIVLTGPSGVGKSTVVARLRVTDPEIWQSVSITTRQARPNEVAGLHYYFVSDAEFDAHIEQGTLLEWAEFVGHRSGTPRAPVEERLRQGVPVLLEIELEGARQVRRAMSEATLVFLAPPSWEVLAARLMGRGTEDEQMVARRLARGKIELAAAEEFDVILVNDNVSRVCEALVALVRSGSTSDSPTTPVDD